GPMAGGPVVITDAVAPLRNLDEPDQHARFVRSIRGRTVVSRMGRPVGKVADVLYETKLSEDHVTGIESRRIIPRYIVVQTGSALKFGKRLTAVPAELVDADQDPVLLRITRAELCDAPRYDTSQPLSRQDEMALRRYFHVRNYWMTPRYDDEWVH
ncbi:MAG TPA: PRC-barrel domain-containing protein, partial [Thermomicrobiales bacterium]|nr:PRC-barrel domain-containing protein [Thermomicrobiales bacterium]